MNCLAWLTVFAALPANSPKTGPIGIIGTFPAEASWLLGQLEKKSKVRLGGLSLHTGILRQRRVVVMICGVGSTNAGAGTALLIERFNPRAIILNGVAGGTGPATPNSIVLGTKVVNFGFGYQNADGGYAPWPTYQPSFTQRNPLYFPADGKLLARARAAAKTAHLIPLQFEGKTFAPKVIEGVIASSDNFTVYPPAISDQQKQTGAIALEEEGASVAQICLQRGVPCLVVRAISNPAGPDGLKVFEKLGTATAANAQRLVAEIVAGL